MVRMARAICAGVLVLVPVVLHADISSAPILVIRSADATLAFAQTDIARASLGSDSEVAQIVTLMLQPHAGAAFASFTETAAAQTVTLSLCGSVLREPHLAMPIFGGMVPIPHLSPARGAAVFAVLAEGAPCPSGGLPQ